MIQASVHGRIGADPVATETSNGKPMTRVSIVVDVTGHNAETENSLWVSVLAFGKAAETLARASKGETLTAQGRLTRGHYTARDGTERESWSLLADAVITLRSARPGQRRGESSRTGRPGMVDLHQLNQAQAAAHAGLLARAMADVIRDLADGHEDRCRDLRAAWREHRDTALKRGLSGRTPEQAAFLLVGYALAVDHWHQAGAITREQAAEQLAQAREILFELAKQHERRISHSQPAVAFVTILADLLRAGAAHLLDTSESRSPVNAPAYGWKPNPHGQLQPQGDHLGWVDETKRELYLIPTVALKAVLSAARHLDAPINLKESALKRQLLDCGFLLIGEVKPRGDSAVQRLTRQVRVGNSRSYVLVMPLDIIEQLERTE